MLQAREIVFRSIKFFVWVKIMRITFGRWEQIRNEKRLFSSVNLQMQFVRKVHSGNIMINWGPQWRADLMPYGGLKDSGMGKEGPRYAVEEMTETKMVVIH